MRRIQVWLAVSASIVLSALLIPVAGANKAESHTGISGAVRYDCAANCYNNYVNCYYAGKGAAYCQALYQTCMGNCATGNDIVKAQ